MEIKYTWDILKIVLKIYEFSYFRKPPHMDIEYISLCIKNICFIYLRYMVVYFKCIQTPHYVYQEYIQNVFGIRKFS